MPRHGQGLQRGDARPGRVQTVISGVKHHTSEADKVHGWIWKWNNVEVSHQDRALRHLRGQDVPVIGVACKAAGAQQQALLVGEDYADFDA